MAGDKFNIRCNSWYKTNGAAPGSPVSPLNELLSALASGVAGTGGAHGATATEITNSGVLTPGATQFLNNHTYDNTKPKAYLNWILLDEQFTYVSSSSGFEQVGGNEEFKTHLRTDMPVDKSGYLYIYVSNETPNLDVYFDNLQVTHTRGAVLEETHYYPFGLVMAGISTKAVGTIQNKEKTFQEQYFDDDLGINYIQFKYRSYDPQIGKFIQIDPLSHDYRYNSTYAFSENRVTDGRELEGLEYVSIHHYADGKVGTKMFYKSTDKEINQRGGTTAGIYNSASYGPLGKGVVHYYYDKEGAVIKELWDQRQTGGSSDLRFHGLYSGPGSITKDGGEKSTNYDFSFQPIDWADAIAKRHDMDYAAATATGEAYAGFLEDVRTVQADKDMVQRIKDYSNPFKDVTGVETPFRTSYSIEMDGTMVGQSIVIDALATYKQWKINNGYGNKDTYDKLRTQFVKDNPGTTDIIDLLIK